MLSIDSKFWQHPRLLIVWPNSADSHHGTRAFWHGLLRNHHWPWGCECLTLIRHIFPDWNWIMTWKNCLCPKSVFHALTTFWISFYLGEVSFKNSVTVSLCCWFSKQKSSKDSNYKIHNIPICDLLYYYQFYITSPFLVGVLSWKLIVGVGVDDSYPELVANLV